jgi:death on curing protein
VIYLTLSELLHIAARVLGSDPPIRDAGLLESAVARPQAMAFGTDAYPDLDSKAAALLHSLARNHALVDGNKRLALSAVIAFYGVNGRGSRSPTTRPTTSSSMSQQAVSTRSKR